MLAAGNTYTAGSEGGEASHVLSIDEMLSHNHSGSISSSGNHTHKIGTDKDTSWTSYGECWSVHNASTGAAYQNGSTSSNGSHSHDLSINETGGGKPHNNMPPYLVVYVWTRVS